MKEGIPRQRLLQSNYIQLINLERYVHELSGVSHRHDHYMLMWITKGHGTHLIDQKEYKMLTNRLFFVHPHQVHQMKDFEREGWLILFDDAVYQLFTRFHPQEEWGGIMRPNGNQPYVDLDQAALVSFAAIVTLIQRELESGKGDLNVYAHLISLLLLTANRLYSSVAIDPNKPDDQKLIHQLEKLIESYYKRRLPGSFYAASLHMHVRSLNALTNRMLGVTLHEMIEERLLTESKILLASSSLTVKEIGYQLGFADPAYFNRFFKKLTGKTPVIFREAQKQGR